MIGRQIAHYRVTTELGSGGMGTVYRAEDTRLGRPVAIKVPRSESMADTAERARFLREARVASALDHPNIVVLYDVGEVDGQVFLAMQYVEGRTLRERLAQGPVPPAEALAIGRAVADALAHAHGRGVVHRDIKPENVLLCEDGRVKVADFGIATWSGEASARSTVALAGTPAYLAPEILRGERASAASDLYALGAVLHELLSGTPAFTGATLAEVLYKVGNEDPATLPSAVPDPVRRLVRRLMARRPQDRPAGAIEAADALLAAGRPAETKSSESPIGRSIAVLGFENLTGQGADEYLCAGITEDLLTDMLKIPDLQVASRSLVGPRRSGAADVRDVGRDLGVATVLEGGVRRAGDRVRVTARLVRTDTGYQLWADRYDRRMEDVFEVQEDISRRIAEALRVVFEPETEDARLGRRTSSSTAYDLRLRAKAFSGLYEESEMRRAIELLEAALREDPDYALARAELAECFTQLICKYWDSDRRLLDRAAVEADRALAIAPHLPEGFRARGHIWMHRRRPDLAMTEFHRATDLDPRLMTPLNSLGVAYMVTGDDGRAEVYTRRAHKVDPFHFAAYVNLSMIARHGGRMDEARDWCLRALTIPLSRLGHLQVVEALMMCDILDRSAAAVSENVAEIEKHLPNLQAQALLAVADAFLGRFDEARGRLADPALVKTTNPAAHLNAARAWVLMGDRAQALESLDRGFRIDIVDVGLERRDPLLADLLADPRFDELRSFGATVSS
jgi:TolB-like protein/Flp pilus assembly protein TadD/predicted Ser/Thr protein kinase